VESNLGTGTTFHFTAVFQVNSAVRPLASVYPASQQTDRPLNILVAEDNAVNQMVIKQVIKKLKHQVKVVENGKLAVEEILRSGNTYDLILMDIQMPEMDGIEATTIIRGKISSEQLPIVALTAHVTTSDMDKCTEAGIDYFVTKPVDVKKLNSILVEISNRTHVPM